MYCFRCGTKVSENTKYCPHCGADVLEELKRYSYGESENIPKEEPKRINQTHNDQYLYSLKYSYGDNDTLIRAYVGENYEKSFNACMLCSVFYYNTRRY